MSKATRRRPAQHRTSGRPTASRSTTSGRRRPARFWYVVAIFLTGLLVGVWLPANLSPIHGAAARESPSAGVDRAARHSFVLPSRGVPHAVADDGQSFVYGAAALARLDAVRRSKKAAILDLFAQVEDNARQIAQDETMLTYFDRMRELHVTEHPTTDALPCELCAAVDQYRQAMNQYYALNYSRFYDILFISPERYVFSSFRLEPDYHTYVDTDTPLARSMRSCLESTPHAVVTDYHFYAPSERASAFFVFPIVKDDVHRGWIVAQYAINVLDALLVDHSELGRTGEVYIVNRDRRMVTDSRFTGERSHLRYTVAIDPEEWPDDAVRAGMMVDYRGIRVFASCERIRTLGHEWVLVAQIDEAEVVTDYYRSDPNACCAALHEELVGAAFVARAAPLATNNAIRVGMDDFARSEAGRPLETRGVSACTAVVVTYPGHFTYLAHLSPYDKVYGNRQLTNILKQVVYRIRHYDIYQSELSKLEVLIVAPHTNSLRGILDKLLRYGITLRQIRFACQPSARYANVFADGPTGRVTIEWVGPPERPAHQVQGISNLPNLASVIRDACRRSAKPEDRLPS